mgnify:CR=1 FL=1
MNTEFECLDGSDESDALRARESYLRMTYQDLSHRLEEATKSLAYTVDGYNDKGLQLSLRRRFHTESLRCRKEIASIRVKLREVELAILETELEQVRNEGRFVASVLQNPDCADLHHDFRPILGDLVRRQTELVREIAELRSQM